MKFPHITRMALLLAAMSSSPLHAAVAEDQWTGKDKALHFAASAASATLATAATAIVFPEANRFITNFALGLIPGTVRELSQRQKSARDMAWNMVGAASGAYFGSQLAIEPVVGPAGEVQGFSISFRKNFP